MAANWVRLSNVSAFNSVSSIRTPRFSSTKSARSTRENESIKPPEIKASSGVIFRSGCLRILVVMKPSSLVMISDVMSVYSFGMFIFAKEVSSLAKNEGIIPENEYFAMLGRGNR